MRWISLDVIFLRKIAQSSPSSIERNRNELCAFHEREWSRIVRGTKKKIAAENYTVLQGGDAVCKTSSINERMECGRHTITREATPSGEKLLNSSALLYRAPGRKCANERDSETSMCASALPVRWLHLVPFSRENVFALDLKLCDLRNGFAESWHSWKCTASMSGRLIGLTIFLFHGDCVLNRCNTFDRLIDDMHMLCEYSKNICVEKTFHQYLTITMYCRICNKNHPSCVERY